MNSLGCSGCWFSVLADLAALAALLAPGAGCEPPDSPLLSRTPFSFEGGLKIRFTRMWLPCSTLNIKVVAVGPLVLCTLGTRLSDPGLSVRAKDVAALHAAEHVVILTLLLFQLYQSDTTTSPTTQAARSFLLQPCMLMKLPGEAHHSTSSRSPF